MDKKNYYEILEVPTDATQEEIQRGYIRAKNAYSQDSVALYSLMTKEECASILQMIEEAYSIISDPDKRERYNKARGIGNDEASKKNNKQKSAAPTTKEPDKTISTQTQHNVTKIVAKQKYSLDYAVDPEVEKEIESANEFTGDFLKKIREYKNVDVPRMAEMTKVSKTYIRFIEDEEFSKLPAPVYVRGFVFQYAKCLKLNPDLVANSFLKRMKSVGEED